ncbi:diguanylate cyclase domain-containing protein [Streptomyces rubiginosohelvolus]|uniref:diguanylate cyclase domain-containing protein n=1 Tax=Streptomyces rubiginosohelvolus TaxID=67362 RepID=UPI0036CEB762
MSGRYSPCGSKAPNASITPLSSGLSSGGRPLARHGDDLAVVMVGADHFNQINDSLGHAAGDAVLAAFGARFTAWAGPRAGGQARRRRVRRGPGPAPGRRRLRLEQLVRMLHTPVVLDDGRTVDVVASVGAATPDALGTRDLTAFGWPTPRSTMASTPAARS